jgi:SAM-dependent methyltransferase
MLSELLSPNITLYPVEPHLFSVYPESERAHDYDRAPAVYDSVIGNPWYNRLMWGYAISEYSSLVLPTLASATSGWVLDAGCGSLVFSAGVYADYRDRPMVMLDRSIEMLRAAKARLIRLNAYMPPNITFLQGDILELPFRPQSLSSVISMGILHVLDNAQGMVQELSRVLSPGGTLSVSSLVLGRWLGDRYLDVLHRAGGVAAPRTPADVLALFSGTGLATEHRVRGNMLFIHAR